MINLHERMLPTSAGVEPATSWSPVGRRIQLSHRGRHLCSWNEYPQHMFSWRHKKNIKTFQSMLKVQKTTILFSPKNNGKKIRKLLLKFCSARVKKNVLYLLLCHLQWCLILWLLTIFVNQLWSTNLIMRLNKLICSFSSFLTLSTHWANSADNKYMISYFPIFP